MRHAALPILIFLLLCANSPDPELPLARELLEDAMIRNDVEGIELARGRLLRLAAAADDRASTAEAHYLVALSALFETYSGRRDLGEGSRIVASGIRHANRAIDLDPVHADAWIVSSMLRWNASRFGEPPPAEPPGSPNRLRRAMELAPKSPAVMFFHGMLQSFNPAGPARPEGVAIIDDLAAQLDAERAEAGRRFGFWDAQAHAWRIMVRLAAEEPSAEDLHPMTARLLELRPDFYLGQGLADMVAERRFAAVPTLEWRPMLTDAAGDGKNAALPDLISVDRADDGERAWYRVTFREPLPRSFGVNLVINRRGDHAKGMLWWGEGSTFRFDRLVTAWITRDGERYFGRVGVTDDDGALGYDLVKLPAEIDLAMGEGDRSVILGVPRAAIGLTEAGSMIVAGGSHLVWNDDATTASNSR